MALFTKRVASLLNQPVGNNLRNNEDDVKNLKTMFSHEKRYKQPVRNGFIDQELNNAIYSFQKENQLKIDGRVNPGGETEAALASTLVLNQFPRTKQNFFKQPTQSAAAAAIPFATPIGAGIAKTLEVLGALGMGIWGTQSKDEREEDIKKAEQERAEEEERRKQDCDDMYDLEEKICGKVTENHGRKRGALCYASAAERNSDCLKGKPEHEWNDLET